MTETMQFKVATPRMAAGLLVQNSDGHVLLVKPSYKPGWDLPGGYVEPGESPRQACHREVHEELGIAISAERLLVVDWAPHPDEGDKVLWIFYGGLVSLDLLNTAQLQAAEIADVRFWHRSALDGLMPPRLTRRIDAALSAVDANVSLYLENGTSPGDLRGQLHIA